MTPFILFSVDDPSTLWAEAGLEGLEAVDDDLDQHNILLVKMSDTREARWGLISVADPVPFFQIRI